MSQDRHRHPPQARDRRRHAFPAANDLIALGAALEQCRVTAERPTLIVVDSHIGFGAPEARHR